MHALKNSARVGADIVSPYRTMLLAWLRGMLAALFMTLIILLLAPIAASSAYATTESSDVQANAPPAIAQTIVNTETETVASGDDSSEVTVVSTDEKSAVTDTQNELGKQENSADNTKTTVDDSNSQVSSDTQRGDQLSNSGDTGTSNSVSTPITDNVDKTILSDTDFTAITADGTGNATIGCDYQGEATDLERANQSLTKVTDTTVMDTSSTPLDNRGEGNTVISTYMQSHESVSATIANENDLITASYEDSLSTAAERPTNSPTPPGSTYYGIRYYFTGIDQTTKDPSVPTTTTVDKIYMTTDGTASNATYVCDSNDTFIVWYGGSDYFKKNIAFYRYGYSYTYGVVFMNSTMSAAIDLSKTQAKNGSSKGSVLDCYIVWNISQFSVNYYDPDHTGDNPLDTESSSDSETIKWDSVFHLPSSSLVASKPGYTFKGWMYEEFADSVKNEYGDSSNPTVYTAKGGDWSHLLATGDTIGSVWTQGSSYDQNLITSTLIVYAVYEKASTNFTITFNANNGAASPDTTTITVNSGSTGTAPTITSLRWTKGSGNTECEFLGWSTSSSATSATFGDGAALTGITSDTTLYAVWKDILDITYVCNGGTTGSGATTVIRHYRDADPKTLPTAAFLGITREGYGFDGWVTSASGTSVLTTMPTSDTTLYAKWTRLQYTVQFVNKYTNTSIDAVMSTHQVYWSGTGASMPTAPSVTTKQSDGLAIPHNYTFSDWYVEVALGTDWTSTSGTTAYGTPTTLQSLLSGITPTNWTGNSSTAGTLTVYAVWTRDAIGYTITYHSNYASGDTTPYSDTYYDDNSGVTTFRPLSDFSQAGYTATGWFTTSAGGGTTYTPGGTISGLTSNLDLYPLWTPKTVSFTYASTDTDSTISYPSSPTSGTIGSNVTLSAATRDGYDFDYWSNDVDTTTVAGGGTFTVPMTNSSSITLTAHWKKRYYTVTYSANGGTLDSSQPATSTTNLAGATLEWTTNGLVDSTGKTPSAERTYYNFLGWSKSSTASTPDVNASTSVSAILGSGSTSDSFTLYAVWDPIYFTINYVTTTGGSITGLTTENVKLDGGTPTGSTAVRVNSGYVFKNWTDNAGDPIQSGIWSAASDKSYGTISPTIDILQSLYGPTNTTHVTSIIYRANFGTTPVSYKVEHYLAKADGTGYTLGQTDTADSGGNHLEDSVGVTVYAQPQRDAFLAATNSSLGMLNSALYTWNSSAAGSVESLTISGTVANNVLKVYYDRTKFNVEATYTNPEPAGAPAASTYNGSYAWGSTVTLSEPGQNPIQGSKGYDFSWNVKNSSTTLATGATASFTMPANNVSAAGTWTLKNYLVSLTDTDSNSGGFNSSLSSIRVNHGSSAGLTNGGGTTAAIWAPTGNDTSTHYFAGWSSDGGTTIISPASVDSAIVTADITYNAVWLLKVSITYSPGSDVDSRGNLKAGFTTQQIVGLSDSSPGVPPGQTLATAKIGNVAKLVLDGTTVEIDSSIPGNTGWEFDYWTVSGNSSMTGHYTTSQIYNISVSNKDWVFVAHWKPTSQQLTYGLTGSVSNGAGTGTTSLTATDTLTNPTAATDSNVVLPTLTGIPAGYEHLGWSTTPNATAIDTGCAAGATIQMYPTATKLHPVFKEKEFTVSYVVASGSTGFGTVSSPASETVHAATHYGASSNAASVANPAGYVFLGWKDVDEPTKHLAGDTISGSVSSTPTIDTSSVLGATVLTANKTYYAVFGRNTFLAQFYAKAPSDTDAHGSVTLSSGGSQVQVPYLDSPTDVTTVTANPHQGYYLSKWQYRTIANPSAVVDVTDKTLNSLQVSEAIDIWPVFEVKGTTDYTVEYYFVIYPHSGGSLAPSGQGSVAMKWNDLAIHTTMASPALEGYSTDGVWYADSSFTIGKEVSSTDTFSNVFLNKVPNPSNSPNTSISLYAKFIEKATFRVEYDLDNGTDMGSFGAAKTGVAWTDGIYAPTDSEVTRTGYTLSGWSAIATHGSSGKTTVTYASGSPLANGSTTAYSLLANNDDDNTLVTLRAVWEPKSYNVTFDYNYARVGGQYVSKPVKWSDTSVDFFNNPVGGGAPTRTGYTFGGWSTTYDLNTVPQQGVAVTSLNSASVDRLAILLNNANADGADNIVLTANWVQDTTYRLNYVLVATDSTESPYTGITTVPVIVPGNTTVVLADLTGAIINIEGYEFDNYTKKWGTNATAASQFVSPNTPIEYNVYYNEKTFPVTYNTNGGTSVPADPSRPAVAWTKDVLPTALVTRDGYNTVAWEYTYTDTTGASQTVSVPAGTTYEQLAKLAKPGDPDSVSTIELKAVWNELPATITFTPVGAGTIEDASHAPLSSVSLTSFDTTTTIPDAIPVANAGATFSHWTYSLDGGATQLTDISSVASVGSDGKLTPIKFAHAGGAVMWHDIIYYANYAAAGSIQVTINDHRENVNPAVSGVTGQWITTSRTDHVTGNTDYTASRLTSGDWAYFDLATGVAGFDQTHRVTDASGDVVFDLYYTAKSFDLTYAYTGTVPAAAPAVDSNTYSYKYGQAVTLNAVPTLAGYSFTGWTANDGSAVNSSASPQTMIMPGNNVTMQGSWNMLTSKVNFTYDTVNDGSKGSVVQSGALSVPTSSNLAAEYGASTTVETLTGLTINEYNGNYISGWDVIQNGSVVATNIGRQAPITYTIDVDTTFRAVFTVTYTITYAKGAHGLFIEGDNNKTRFEGLHSDASGSVAVPEYDGLKDTTGENAGNPKADAGWLWLGWGVQNASTGAWTYYFDYDGDGMTGPNEATFPSTVTSNTEFVAFWKGLDRTLTFSNTDGTNAGTFTSSPSIGALAGSVVTLTVPTGGKPTLLGSTDFTTVPAGYTFAGWSTSQNATSAQYAGGSTSFEMPGTAAGTTLYPVWQFTPVRIFYSVASDSLSPEVRGDVSGMSDTLNKASDILNGSTPMAYAGYEFDYWTRDASTTHLVAADGVGANGKLVPVARESATYYAHFKPISYELIYNKGTGEGDTKVVAAKWPADRAADGTTVWYTNVVPTTAPERDGYTFDGWYLGFDSETGTYTNAVTGTTYGDMVKQLNPTWAHAGHSFDAQLSAVSSVTLYAKWSAQAPTLTYIISDTSGAYWRSDHSNTNIVETNHETDSNVTLKGNADVRLFGYELAGWSTTLNAGTYDYAQAATIKMTPGALTLYPVWVPMEYDIVFDENKPADATDPTQTVNNMPDPSDPAYVAKYNDVEWTANGFNTSVNPELLGYHFLGWNTDPDAKVASDGVWVTGTSDPTYATLADNDDSLGEVTLYAIWALNKYRIYYVDSADGVSTVAATRVDGTWFGAGLDTTHPTKTGYTFVGWAGEANGSAINASGTKYYIIASIPSQNMAEEKYIGSASDNENLYGIKLYALWKQNVDFMVRVVLENPDNTDGKIAPLSNALGYNTPYNSYAGVKVTLNVGGTNVSISTDPSNGTADNATSPVPSQLVLPTIVGYTYDAARSEAGNALTATLDAETGTKVFTLYYAPKGGFTIIYDANDGTFGSSNTYTRGDVTWGTRDLQIDADGSTVIEPTRTGYKLAGWTAKYVNSGAHTLAPEDIYGDLALGMYASVTDAENPDNPVTLTAIWTPREYNINYIDLSMGTTETSDKLVRSSIDDASHNPATHIDPVNWTDAVSVEAPTLGNSSTNHSTGWQFLGWSLIPNNNRSNTALVAAGTTFGSLFGDMFAARDVDYDLRNNTDGLSLYAVWAKLVPYTIEFYKEGETDPFKIDTISHTDSLNPGVAGKSAAASDSEITDSRPQGYNNGTSTSVTLDEDTTRNVVAVTYELNRDFVLELDYNDDADSTDAADTSMSGLTWFTKPVITESGLTRNGYTFANKWNTKADGSGISYVLESGTWVATDKDGNVTKLADQAYSDLALAQGILSDTAALAKPVRLFAQWNENADYQVNYELGYEQAIEKMRPKNYASLSISPKLDVAWSSKDIRPDNEDSIEKPYGYHLEGWTYTDSSGKTHMVDSGTSYATVSEAMGNSNTDKEITLTAKWAEDVIEITYVARGSGGTVTRTIDKITAVTGMPVSTTDSAAFSSLAKANPGYHFIKWQLVDADSSSELSAMALVPSDGSVSNTVTSVETDAQLTLEKGSDGIYHAATYEALFEANDPATLIYNVNGGTGTIDSVTEPFGSILTLSDGYPYTRKYHTLKNWNTKADGTGITYELGYTGYELPEGTTTLYAMWQVNSYPVTISGVAEGGTVNEKTEDVEYNKTISSDAVKEAGATPLSGYVLKGWTYTMTDAETGVVSTGTVNDPSELTICGPVTFTALFEEDPSLKNPDYLSDGNAPGSSSNNGGGNNANANWYGGDSAATYGADVPQTGDSENMMLILAIAALIAMMLAVRIARRLRAEKEQV